MKILKNTSTLTNQEVIRRVEEFVKFFSGVFSAPAGIHAYIVMPNGTVSSTAAHDSEIIVDHAAAQP